MLSQMEAVMVVHPPRPPHLHDEARYRAFLIDPDGRVVAIEHLAARDDEAALVLARTLVDGHAVELWDGMRFIEHFDALASQTITRQARND
ncbi:hypothetical protein [Methylobacterium oxalidis]|uniref:hypothetical protein n=1 Tax=Methylobacterium oxalidis TaxID=944322 RepID=UPI0033152536